MYLVHGLTRSYFTRKVTGYLDYTRPAVAARTDGAGAGGAPGGHGGRLDGRDPRGRHPVGTADVGLDIDDRTPRSGAGPARGSRRAARRSDAALPRVPARRLLRRVVLPAGRRQPVVLRRPTPITAGWQLAEELAVKVPVPGAMVRQIVVATMTGSLGRIGVHGRPDRRVDERGRRAVVRARSTPTFAPMRAVATCSVNDRRSPTSPCSGRTPRTSSATRTAASSPTSTGRPSSPTHTACGFRRSRRSAPWLDAGDVPPTLVAVVAEAGRHYLPWVAEATCEGSAVVELADGVTARIESSRFLEWARGVLLARYVELRVRCARRRAGRGGRAAVLRRPSRSGDRGTGLDRPAPAERQPPLRDALTGIAPRR